MADRTGTIHKVMADLVERPLTTIADTAARHGISSMNANRVIGHLAEAGILTELTGKSYRRTFGAIEVMNIVDRI
jgi:DNA-binding IscR family transcriptional regulator